MANGDRYSAARSMPNLAKHRYAALVFAMLAVLAIVFGACGNKEGTSSTRTAQTQVDAGLPPPPPEPEATCVEDPGSLLPAEMQNLPIQYVFVLMQENRSFDSYFGRFQDYLRDVVNRKDPRIAEGGIDVPGKPFELRDPCDKDQQDQVGTAEPNALQYNPRNDAPFNPAVAGAPPATKAEKHYWQHAKAPLQQCVSDTCHEWWCSHLEWDSGRMDGFFQANDKFTEGGEPMAPPTELSGNRGMYYYDQTDIPFYYALADEFAIADHYYASLLGPTWPNRDYLYGATSRGLVSNSNDNYDDPINFGMYAGEVAANPPVRNAPNGTPLNTIYDAMEAFGAQYTQWVRTRYNVTAAKWGTWYGQSGVVPMQTTKNYNSPDNGFERHVQTENTAVMGLLASGTAATAIRPQGVSRTNPDGSESEFGLNEINFIDPDYLEDVNGEDEHPPGEPRMGQRFVYDVVRVLQANREVWKRSVLFIVYDEGGGFYDHVAPPKACPPDDHPPLYTGPYGPHGKGVSAGTDPMYAGAFDRYGGRVPLIVVSPWANHRYVSHVTYDHTSITRFIEGRFGLPALTKRDANANPLLDFFDFKDAGAKLGGGAPGWGAESSVAGPFPSAPGDNPKSGAMTSAEAVRWYPGTVPDDQRTMKANPACLGAYPPAPAMGSPTALGATVYDIVQGWSKGIAPPPSYKADESRPFSFVAPAGTGTLQADTGTCTTQQIRVKVVTTISGDPNDPLADPLLNVDVLIGGTVAHIPDNDDLARVTVPAGGSVVKFPKSSGLDDMMGKPIFKVGSVNVSETKGNIPSKRCAPLSQEGDVPVIFDPASFNPNALSEYEIGVRIVPFDAGPLKNPDNCP